MDTPEWRFTAVTLTRPVLLVGASVAVVCELLAGRFSIASILLAFWVALPFWILFQSTRGEVGKRPGALHLSGAFLLGASSLAAYRPASIASSSTAGLVFLFLPLWQLMGVGLVVFVTNWLSRRRARSGT